MRSFLKRREVMFEEFLVKAGIQLELYLYKAGMEPPGHNGVR